MNSGRTFFLETTLYKVGSRYGVAKMPLFGVNYRLLKRAGAACDQDARKERPPRGGVSDLLTAR